MCEGTHLVPVGGPLHLSVLGQFISRLEGFPDKCVFSLCHLSLPGKLAVSSQAHLN